MEGRRSFHAFGGAKQSCNGLVWDDVNQAWVDVNTPKPPNEYSYVAGMKNPPVYVTDGNKSTIAKAVDKTGIFTFFRRGDSANTHNVVNYYNPVPILNGQRIIAHIVSARAQHKPNYGAYNLCCSGLYTQNPDYYGNYVRGTTCYSDSYPGSAAFSDGTTKFTDVTDKYIIWNCIKDWTIQSLYFGIDNYGSEEQWAEYHIDKIIIEA